MVKKYEISGMCCAGCATKIEANIAKIDGVNEVSVSYATMKILIDYDESRAEQIFIAAQAVVDKIEPGMKILF